MSGDFKLLLASSLCFLVIFGSYKFHRHIVNIEVNEASKLPIVRKGENLFWTDGFGRVIHCEVIKNAEIFEKTD